jgi:hypothetical protein
MEQEHVIHGTMKTSPKSAISPWSFQFFDRKRKMGGEAHAKEGVLD